MSKDVNIDGTLSWSRLLRVKSFKGSTWRQCLKVIYGSVTFLFLFKIHVTEIDGKIRPGLFKVLQTPHLEVW